MLDEEPDIAVEESPALQGEDRAIIVDACGQYHHGGFGTVAHDDCPAHDADQEDDAGHEECASVIPIEQAQWVRPIPIQDAHFVNPAQWRNRKSDSVDPSLIISVSASVLIHGLVIGLAILLCVRYTPPNTPPKFRAQAGDGVTTGETGAISQSDPAAGVGQTPPSLVQDNSPPSLRTDLARSAEAQALDTIPPEFTAPPIFDKEQTPTDPILFGYTPASIQEPMPARHSPSLAAAKLAAAAGHDATASSSAGHPSDGAVTAAGSLAGGSGGKAHVWTGIRPAGKGGGGGRGGARDGLNSNGWPIPDYPRESRRRGEEGRVELEMEMRADGSVGNIKIVRDPGFPRLAAAAIEAAHRVKFDPATCDGKPVTITVIVPFDFSLK